MNDLISRSALIKVLKARATNEAIMGYMTAYDVTNSIIDEVEEQTTAYSVDKVVEELENELEKGNIAIDFGEFRLFEIVKQEGVSDDVCEWEQDKDFDGMYKTCSGDVTYFKDFKYCPYCGKKIKVVG